MMSNKYNKLLLPILIFLSIFPFSLFAQMWNPILGDTLYGNEWINYERADRYFKIKVATDGIYQISANTLQSVGVDIANIDASRYQLFCRGESVPLHVLRETGSLQSGDFIRFYGEKNQSQVDQYLFKDAPAEMLNPDYSLFSDTSIYYLTWTDEVGEESRMKTLENNLNGSLPNPEPWFIDETVLNFNNDYFKTYQKIIGFDVYYSHFDVAEGFCSNRSSDRQLTLNATQLHPEATNAEVDLRLATNVGEHQLQITINNETYLDTTSSAVALFQPTYNIPITDEQVSIHIKGALGSADQHVLATAKLRYPRKFDFSNQNYYKLELTADNRARLLEIKNFANNAEKIQLWDISNQKIFTADRVGEAYQFLYPPTNQAAQLILVAETSYQDIDQLQPITFIDYSALDGEFIMLSHQDFINPTNGESQVNAYVEYRQSITGGGFKTAIIDIEQLYDQFAYGIYSHPISIRNFAHYIQKKWTNPQYFFIIGKGREYRDLRTANQLAAADRQTFFVPTFGWPASDNLLISNNLSAIPIFPIGRIAVKNNEQLATYLTKVKQHEAGVNAPQTIEGRAWMKELLHLGGSVGAEAQQIRTYLSDMEQIAANNTLGANVTSVYKTNSDPFQISRTEAIFNRINQGVSIISFFGHSSPGRFDINIDSPVNYQNKGKYPLMLSFGCYSGNIFTTNTAISERFVFYEDKGAIAFGASRGLGFVSSLSQYGNQIYELASGELYGQPIGKILQATIANFDDRADIGMGILREQYTFQGDPALRLNSSEGADFVIDNQSIQFEPEVVNTQADSFKVSMDIVNLGQYIADSIDLVFEQQLIDGTRLPLATRRIAAPVSSTNQVFKLPTQKKAPVGENRLLIKVDATNKVEELPLTIAENNNELIDPNGAKGIAFFTTDNTAFPIFPNKYGVVNQDQVTLKASITNAFAPERTYVFELDTKADFSNPSRKRGKITQTGGVLEWQPDGLLQLNQTYYWRVSPDSIDAQIGYIWEESSFTYLADEAATWAQTDIGQLGNNDLLQIQVDSVTNQLRFVDDFISIYLKNKVYSNEEPAEYIHNGSPFGSPWSWSVHEGLNVVVFADETIEYWRNPSGGEHGAINIHGSSKLAYSYKTDNITDRSNFINFIESVIPDNYYAIVYSAQRTFDADYYPESWAADSLALDGKNIFNVLENQGATKVRKLAEIGAVPYVLMFQKGQGKLNEVRANNIDETITINHVYQRKWFEGEMSSTQIGPAKKWDNLEIVLNESEIEVGDSIAVEIIGINKLEEEVLFNQSNNLKFSLTEIDANEYPFIKYRIQFIDNEQRSIPTLEKVIVEYEKTPEFALNPFKNAVFPDTIQVGQEIEVVVAVENVGGIAVDSLQVNWQIKNADGTNTALLKKYAVVTEGATNVDLKLTTDLEQKIENIGIQLNPTLLPVETHLANNFGQKSITTLMDRSNPLLNVTFNQRQILQGDIIEPNSRIEVSLDDDNPYLIIKDTTALEVYLTYPDGTNRRLSFADTGSEFIPASEQQNRARATFQPNFSQDGLYHLSVQGRDVTGNKAGDIAYEVDFEVIRKELISNVLAYPNPFTTSTKFVYTLTGEQVPDHYQIQVLTASGRVVRVLTEADLGQLKIGRHQTEFAWNGTDEFGNRLANGVYLYRLILKNAAGEDYEQLETAVDPFFKAGFGKVVLMR